MAEHALAGGPQEPDENPDEVFNLDAVANEAEGTFPFKLGGDIFHLAHPEDIERKALRRLEIIAKSGASEIEAIEENLKILMGSEQFERFDKHDLTLRQLLAVMTKWSEHFGIGLPESKPSTRSSGRKARK